jgi:hypothetical protein
MTPDICCVMEKSGEMGNNVVLLTKHRLSSTWVHVRCQVQAGRVGLDIRGSGEELASKTKMTARTATKIIGLQPLIRMGEGRVAAEM